ncbi:hypothetical protein PF006_g3565 [Phytophthora fragariae]|uniref:Uncharacterized protein n=1 Tax=Phytophthora fragariae TaxID=53985 RepID=A0A6A3M4X3_9STRA|nr:hypothetical protein PF003_g19286 [Phytophthora fragariae]KAE9024775.1 hypothetical protein PF011_g3362 [Phytophthora fragariae]KAE9152229.1 hypothetical protein PF006_g3565 [Phytophthora fragariae]KAE9249159.1 hypothetical protein PF004_g3537 [Phytophthora fragariae]
MFLASTKSSLVAAFISAVTPMRLTVSTSTPRSPTRYLMAATHPERVAFSSTVSPSPSVAFTSTPHSVARYIVTSVCPLAAAFINASTLVELTSPVQAPIRYSTISMRPQPAAFISAVIPSPSMASTLAPAANMPRIWRIPPCRAASKSD